ncbi:hypothetical protein GYH30_052529 [Glycine max]|nr:hypothetical protein GYH30_052529 [Glycine max]
MHVMIMHTRLVTLCFLRRVAIPAQSCRLRRLLSDSPEISLTLSSTRSTTCRIFLAAVMLTCWRSKSEKVEKRDESKSKGEKEEAKKKKGDSKEKKMVSEKEETEFQYRLKISM